MKTKRLKPRTLNTFFAILILFGASLAGCLGGDDDDTTDDVATGETTTGYLYDDPSSPTSVNTVVPNDFATTAPLAACILEHFQLTGDAENAALLFADAYEGADEPTMAAAEAFLADENNTEMIASWTDECAMEETGYLYDDPATPTSVNTVVPVDFDTTAPMADCILSNFQMTGAAENAALLFADGYDGDGEATLAAAEDFFNDDANNETITGWSTGCESADLGAEVLEFGVPAWSGEMFRSYLAQLVLEDAGYTVNLNEGLDPAAIYTGLAGGDYHVYFGSWLPAQQATYEPNQDDLTIIGENLEPGAAFLALAVPQYMCDQGLTNLSDLADFADELDSTITGIEAGAGMQQTAETLVDEGGYGLDGWTVSSSSTAAMLSEYDSAVQGNEPIVVMTWAPHAMYAKWTGEDAMCALGDDGYEIVAEA